MFRLGRGPDVLPVDDLGVRQACIQRVDSLAFGLRLPKALCIRGECWAPYRTYAGLYLPADCRFPHEGEEAMTLIVLQDE